MLTADTASAIDQLRADARAAAEASRAPSSERAYAADLRDFCAFAARIGRQRLPAEAETVALYVAADLTRRGRRPAIIARKLAAIAVYHRSMDHPAPTDHDVVRGRGPRHPPPIGRVATQSRYARGYRSNQVFAPLPFVGAPGESG